jgi:NhaP-type Na+/H+ or K+/H+ antiporter
MDFKLIILCSYAGLRGAVGISLALMVAVEDKLSHHVRDIILLHVAGVALLTLIINATTTGFLVRKLGLLDVSDIKKNMLYSVS